METGTKKRVLLFGILVILFCIGLWTVITPSSTHEQEEAAKAAQAAKDATLVALHATPPQPAAAQPAALAVPVVPAPAPAASEATAVTQHGWPATAALAILIILILLVIGRKIILRERLAGAAAVLFAVALVAAVAALLFLLPWGAKPPQETVGEAAVCTAAERLLMCNPTPEPEGKGVASLIDEPHQPAQQPVEEKKEAKVAEATKAPELATFPAITPTEGSPATPNNPQPAAAVQPAPAAPAPATALVASADPTATPTVVPLPATAPVATAANNNPPATPPTPSCCPTCVEQQIKALKSAASIQRLLRKGLLSEEDLLKAAAQAGCQ